MKRYWFLEKILLPSSIVFVGLILWQVYEDKINEQRVVEAKTSLEFFIPTPLTIVDAGIEHHKRIAQAMAQTLRKSLAGFTIGILFGIAVAVIYTLYPPFRSATLPIAFAIQSFPVVGLAPAVVLALGQDSFLSIAVISAILAYFPVLLSLDDAFINIDISYLELSYIYAANKWQILRYIKFPLAIPAFLTALKLAMPASIVGATIGEWMGSSSGIGRMITLALYQLKPAVLYSCLAVLAIVSASTVFLIYLAEKLFFRWIQLKRNQYINL